MRLLTLAALFWFLLDQGSKWGVRVGLDLVEGGTYPVLPPLLVFRLGWNDGINFGLFGDSPDAMRWVLTAIALAISAAVFVWARKTFAHPLAFLAAGSLIGGALGNALDRVLFGAVVDFLNMSCCGIQNPFVFNLADVGIFLGAFGLIFFADRADKTP